MWGFLVLLSLPACSLAQSPSGIVDPSRAIDWSGAGMPGIPNRTTLCSTLNPGATSAQINSAIASCPSGQVVYLNAGTYALTAGIDFANHNNVTLRGAGADQTFLVFSGGVNCRGLSADVCLENRDTNYPGGPSNSASWTSGYSKGTTQITLSNTAGLSPGNSIIVLDQLNDSSDPGTVYICETQNVCSTDGSAGGERTNRSQQQLVRVTGVSGNTVTISPGLYMPNWRASQAPGAWWGNTIVTGDGVENLSLDHTLSGSMSGIIMFNSYQCWVMGVKSIDPNRNHVWLYLAAHSVVRDSYFYATQNAASESYGVETFMGSDNLIENNIFQKITAPMILNGSGSGTVFGYNYAFNDYYVASPAWMQASNYLHSAGTDMILEEGNESSGLTADNVHGTHNFLTAFRNQFLGWEPGKAQQTIPVNLYTGSRYFNIIGNVLGKAGYHTQYQDLTPSGSNGDVSIYALGWSGNEGGNGSCCKNDPNVAATLMRWGNYDSVTNSVQWNPNEVPSGLGQYGNPVPSTHTLPNSFYLSGKPSFWGAIPWPAIGPDVSGGTDPSGHVYANPAQSCYNSSGKDGIGALIFNSARCYLQSGIGTPPAPPTKLTSVVQ